MLRIVCGIAGVLDWERPPEAAIVQRMIDTLRHRGPDAEGVWARGPVVLGHCRLSIIDPRPEGNQPISDTSGRFWLTYNGEIYNFQEIRAELESAGARFRTRTDSEVMLEAYKKWGVEFVRRLNGMFAFALWDEDRSRLVLARDRLGKKPLYLRRLPNKGLVFASELRALRLHPAVDQRVSAKAVGHYLSLNYTLTQEAILEGVSKLPAATYMVVDRDGAGPPQSYWDLARSFREKRTFRSEAAAAEELVALLDDAVRLRLISDVPLGAFLSGGVDSAVVVASMVTHARASQTHTFSIDFEEKSYSEVDAARETAKVLGVDHRDRRAEIDGRASLEAILKTADEPFADSSMIPTYFLARFARERVTVSLSGDGGDEVFAGYDTYAADRLRHATRWVPGWATGGAERAVSALWPVSYDKVSTDYKLRHFLAGHRLGADRAHYSWREIFTAEEKKRLLRPEWRTIAGADTFSEFAPHFEAVRGCHYLDRAMYADIKTWLVDDILVKVDRATMAHALEARAPMLDYRVVEFAASLPVDWKLHRLTKKFLLRRSQRGRLPAAILDRPKRGFGAPISYWLDGVLGDAAREITQDPSMAQWFEPTEVDLLWREHRARRADNGLKLFGLTCFGLWLSNQ
jgi:asparagine synthase (glutamine-hydrolysing)